MQRHAYDASKEPQGGGGGDAAAEQIVSVNVAMVVLAGLSAGERSAEMSTRHSLRRASPP